MKKRIKAFRLAASGKGHPRVVTRLDRLLWWLGFKYPPTACWGYLQWFFVYWPTLMLFLFLMCLALEPVPEATWAGVILVSALLGMGFSVLQLRWIEKTGVDWYKVWKSTEGLRDD